MVGCFASLDKLVFIYLCLSEDLARVDWIVLYQICRKTKLVGHVKISLHMNRKDFTSFHIIY